MRLASVQMDVVHGELGANLSRVKERLAQCADLGVDLAVFPECVLTGYAAASREEALAIAADPAEVLPDLHAECLRLGLRAVVGYAGRSGESVRNEAALLGPEGILVYAKTHLPFMGLDRFAERGTELPVFGTALGRIGILICYDLRPPEAARVLTLSGADLVVVPTNWPEGARTLAEHVVIARAAENKVFFASCNRVGEERGFRFIGRSKIVSPVGTVLAAAGDGEEILWADVDLAVARQKRTVNIPGEYEIDVLGERHPELYGVIGQRWTS